MYAFLLAAHDMLPDAAKQALHRAEAKVGRLIRRGAYGKMPP